MQGAVDWFCEEFRHVASASSCLSTHECAGILSGVQISMSMPGVLVQVKRPDLNHGVCSGIPWYADLLCDRSYVWQVILPELWDAAVDLFDASRAGVVSDRKRTQKVQEKVKNIRYRNEHVGSHAAPFLIPTRCTKSEQLPRIHSL